MNFTNLCLALIMILVFTLLSCGKQQQEPVDLGPLKQTIAEFVEAVNSTDGDKMAEFYTDDAIQLPPNHEMIRGKQAIKEYWVGQKYASFELNMTEVELTASGTVACQVNKASVRFEKEGQAFVESGPGKNVHIWKKGTDGSWKLHIDIWNSSVPEQAERADISLK